MITIILTILTVIVLVLFVLFIRKENTKNMKRLDLEVEIEELDFFQKQLSKIKNFDYSALIDLHKEIVKYFPIYNLLSDKYGIFRTDSISTMTEDEIFLGGIYGLFTNSLTHWKELDINEEEKQIIWNQYYYLVKTNIDAERIKKEKEYEKLA
jgi:hypothetical protein